jgi:uncharacterized protein (DUF924 family)
MSLTLFQGVLDFWFNDQHKPNWFAKDPTFDQLITQTFEPLYLSMKDKKLDAWVKQPDILLALVILFDQFPRNMYRGTPKSFETDAKAILLTHFALQKKMDATFNVDQKPFLYMPLMHSENRNDQELSLKLFGRTHAFAKAHYDIIKQFGRFPHRNDILERASTPAEIEFLKTPGAHF